VKRTLITLTGLATLGIAVYLGSRLSAQVPPPPAAPVAPPAAPKPLQTRIGLVNMVKVLKEYKKFQTIEEPIKARSKVLEANLEGFRQQLIALKTKYNQPQTTQAEKDQIEKQSRELQARATNAEDDAKKELTKLQGDAAVQIYQEVKTAVEHFAMQNGYEAVFFYNDAVTPADEMHPVNVQRKLMQPACLMPMYAAPGMDISASIVYNLNIQYNGQTTMAPGTAPAPPPHQ
jgi:Skp family chaperone for outer membrane proteins